MVHTQFIKKSNKKLTKSLAYNFERHNGLGKSEIVIGVIMPKKS